METKTPQVELTQDDLLISLIEECAEVQQAATKCLRFGWDRYQEHYGRNNRVLGTELEEVMAIAKSLFPDLRASTSRLDRMRVAKEKFGRARPVA